MSVRWTLNYFEAGNFKCVVPLGLGSRLRAAGVIHDYNVQGPRVAQAISCMIAM